MPEPMTLEERLTEYLALGGLFNPELMNHDKVRDLLIDLRATLAQRREGVTEAMVEAACEAIAPVNVGHPWSALKDNTTYGVTMRENVRIILTAALGAREGGGR